MSDTTASLAAALWDFDGTLADTEPIWIEGEFELVGQLGGSWSVEHAHQLVGNSLLDSGAYILNTIGRPDLTPEWVVNWLINYVVDRVTNGPMPWRPGAFELLTGLRAAGVPCALVSASYRILLDAALARLPQDTFQVSVAGDEVTNGKPHPEPYERACHALGVDARHCVVLEDSETGARAGNAAGAVVVAIPNKVAVSAAPRRVHVGSLAELDVAALARLVEDADDPA
ncbi:MAG TPA: HAD family phosphatase [Propionibacteriaceae bacterium]|jgi:HAD superfamily hydrolase (TIGR01509 family)|nr:HAD family phosphatase [Propionibacteriaceae bacterium]